MKHLLLASLAASLAHAFCAAQTRVDLHPFQTPLKNQGARSTCIAFSATAALEARYKRLGTELDLSEEFVNYIGKLMWLHPYWDSTSAPNGQFWISSADRTENQLCATGGGGGVGHAYNMVHWMRVPAETAMPYRLSEYSLPHVWNSIHWDSQRNINAWNLDPANLPRSALVASQYHAATGLVDLGEAGSRNTATIENALRNGFEVIWDGHVMTGLMNNTAAIWHPAGRTRAGAHSMLIVGYDRTDANPANHHFIVKNSWGPTANPNGYTYIGYDYIASEGINACHLTGATAPAAWPELRAIGRRNLSIDGHRGTLDIYHIPGASTQLWQGYNNTYVDRRIGTFYDASGNAHRVNGRINGNQVTFWFKSTNPNMRWDEERETPTLGRMFNLNLLEDTNLTMAGIHWDNSGSVPAPAYGSYAAKPSTMNGTDGFATPVFNNAQSWNPLQWLGEWNLKYAERSLQVVVQHRDDNLIPAAERTTWAGMQCVYRQSGQWLPVTARVDLANAREFRLSLPGATSADSVNVYMQSWARGTAAGRSVRAGTAGGSLMVREGHHSFGSYSHFGTGCGTLSLEVTGLSEVSSQVVGTIRGLPSSGIAFMALGLSRTQMGSTPLPMSLNALGAPGCSVWVDPAVTYLVPRVDSTAAQAFIWYDPALVGLRYYMQGFALSTGANALGVLSTNGAELFLGGTR